MNGYNDILCFKQWLVKYCGLFLISSIMFFTSLILADTKDFIDQNLECSDRLISLPSINTNRNVIINASGAKFKEKYYPDIDNLQRHLEHLSTIKYVNGITRIMINLMLVTSEGRLDVLRSTFAINVNMRFSMSDEVHHIETYEIKYSLYEIFNDRLGRVVISDDPAHLKVLRHMRLVIMEAFSETFLDFINERVIAFDDNKQHDHSFGLENHRQRSRFLNALNRDLRDIKHDIIKEDQKHKEIARGIIDPDYENTEELNTKVQDFANLRMLEVRALGDGYERDHFRNSLLNGRISQVVNAFRENGSILSSYD